MGLRFSLIYACCALGVFFSCAEGTKTETWIDPTTGLEWHAEWGGVMTWQDASSYCWNPNGWRLPNISELRSLLRNCSGTTGMGGKCKVADVCLECNVDQPCLDLFSECHSEECYGCTVGEPDFDQCHLPSAIVGECTTYWSFSQVHDRPGYFWGVSFRWGDVVDYQDRDEEDYPGHGVLCVRSGQ